MWRTPIVIFLLMIAFSSSGQTLEDLSFGTDSTLEVVTWNIEWFPKNDQITVDFVTEIIDALDVDLLAIQEVDSIKAFNQMMDSLITYNGYLKSGWFAGLAYIYKPATIQINDIYEIYTTSPYWSPFPRSPMVMDFNFMNERIILINNHFKCCGDGILDADNQGDEESRRQYASNLLKEYIDTYFPNENTIVVGDLNDILTDDIDNNVFQQIIDDDQNYKFADFEIAFGNLSEWSYPTWPSHLDHILISNELFDEFENENSLIQTIKMGDYLPGGWKEYEENISDHRPVAMKLMMNSTVSAPESLVERRHFSNYPNPFSSVTRFSFPTPNESKVIEILNTQGQIVFSEEIQIGEASTTWNAEGFPNGIYLAKLLSNNNLLATLKILVRK